MPNPIREPANLKLGCYDLPVGLSLQRCCKATRPCGMPSADLTALLLGKGSSAALSQPRIYLSSLRIHSSAGLRSDREQALCNYP